MKYIVQAATKHRIMFLLNPSEIGATPGPRTFTEWAVQARKFNNSEAHVHAGWLQRCGFRRVVVLPAPSEVS